MRNAFVTTALQLYGVLGLASGLVIVFALNAPERVVPADVGALVGLALGAAAAIPVEVVSLLLFRHSAATSSLSQTISGIIGPVSSADLMVLALASGIAEELLFRGLIQTVAMNSLGTAAGLTLASLGFGVLHYAPRTSTSDGHPGLQWMAFATGMGFYMGALYIWTGNIIAPAVTHILVNFINLHAITDTPPIARWLKGDQS